MRRGRDEVIIWSRAKVAAGHSIIGVFGCEGGMRLVIIWEACIMYCGATATDGMAFVWHAL